MSTSYDLDKQAVVALLLRRSKLDEQGCLLWQGSTRLGGYGCIRIVKAKKTFSTHRLSWMVFCGPIPPGMWVLHKCDVPACVNPKHLFLGTHRDNMRDLHEKGRRNGIGCGETNGNARLTEMAVREIVRLYLHNRKLWTQEKLAAKFGVTETLISNILTGKTWKHINSKKLTPDDYRTPI